MIISILKWVVFIVFSLFLYRAIYHYCVEKRNPQIVIKELFEDSIATGTLVVVIAVASLAAAGYLMYVALFGNSLF